MTADLFRPSAHFDRVDSLRCGLSKAGAALTKAVRVFLSGRRAAAGWLPGQGIRHTHLRGEETRRPESVANGLPRELAADVADEGDGNEEENAPAEEDAEDHAPNWGGYLQEAQKKHPPIRFGGTCSFLEILSW
jgi:hypothetical protein